MDEPLSIAVPRIAGSGAVACQGDLKSWGYQLRHACQSQFRALTIGAQPLALENLLRDESLTKTLSITYKELFSITPARMLRCRERWQM